MTNEYVIDTFELTHDGRTFRAETFHDEDMGEPWKVHDGHGVISDWTTRDKRPGERVLISDRSNKRYYDIAETQKIALRDGWDTEPYGTGTKRERAARAVEADFERMQAWCKDEWSWVWLKVTLLDSDDEPTDEYETLGGIEGDSGMEYLKEEAESMAGEISDRLPSVEYAGDIPMEVSA